MDYTQYSSSHEDVLIITLYKSLDISEGVRE